MNRIQKKLLYLLPHSLAHKIMYKIKYNKKLNLKNPKTIDDKLHWLMVYKYGKKESKLTDKYTVRNYVEKKGHKECLTKLYHIYDSANEIDISELPESFVLKTNNSSGQIFICNNKKEFDLEWTKRKLKKQLKENYASNHLEYHYSRIKPKIICEEYIGELDGTLPIDYKFFCFGGKADCVMCCSEREKNVKYDYYDLNWNYLNYTIKKYSAGNVIQKPKNLEKMIKIAEDLSKNFDFVRVDLYDINGKIYFGELTFTPFGGSFYANTEESILDLGNKLKIKE